MSFLKQLSWRCATKKFDSTRSLSVEAISTITNAVAMAPSSFGLQPFYVKVVSDEKIRTQLMAAGWNQQQFITAGHVLIFIARTDFDHRLQEFLVDSSKAQGKSLADMSAYGNMIKGFIEKRTTAEKLAWSQRQAYLALGFALAACAELGIDSCPMEGFNPEEFDKILGLPAHESTCVALPIGYRSPDFIQAKSKVRFKDVVR
ncbi:MAG: NAD(P)H-dependent oxidoreductase [Proteobacteria bacterium]|nr:NAD(P)H-dependent oxidoreductase [Pseudomonadota bacterium]